MKRYEYAELRYEAKDILFLMTDDYKKIIESIKDDSFKITIVFDGKILS